MAVGNCGNYTANHCFLTEATGPYVSQKPIHMNKLSATLEVDCLAVENNSDQFADWEMWMNTNDTNPNSTTVSNTWVEAGYTAGFLIDDTVNPTTVYTGFSKFWADSRPNGSYHEHWVSWAYPNTYTTIEFDYVGSSNWFIAMNGVGEGGSSSNGAYAGATSLGVEMAVDTGGYAWAHALSWQYANGGPWLPVNPSRKAQNNIPNFSISSSFNPTSVSVTTPGRPCGSTPMVATGVDNTAAATPPTLARVKAIAVAATDAHAHGKATSVSAVRTTRGAATGVSGSSVTSADADEEVYLVQETGSFVAAAKSPTGSKEIDGGAMQIVIDARTGQVLDWGIQRAPDPTAALGPALTLP